MSKSSQQFYDHQREFGNVEQAEQMYLIEQAEYLHEINETFRNNSRGNSISDSKI